MLMDTADSKLNRQTTAREAVEETSSLEHAWAPTPEIGPYPDVQDEGVEGNSARLHLYTSPDAAFSAIALRDRVVIMLLFDQVVREDQVHQAWQLWQQMSREGAKEPLWRVLTLFPDLDRELVYAEAARVYGFEEARISRIHALGLIKEMQAHLDRNLWDQMVELRVMPVAEVMQKHSHIKRLVFATPDPTRPEVHRLLPELDLGGYELRYVRESEILNLLIEAFPRRYNHLRGLSGVTKDFLASAFPDAETAFEEGAEGIADPVVLSTEEIAWETPSGPSALSVFEDVLVDGVRQEATDLCLLPHPNGQIDVYYQFDDKLTRQRIIEHILPSMFLKTIKGGVIRQDGPAGTIQKRLIQRWIDDRLVRFRVSAVPAGDEIHSECIVVRIYA